MPNLMKPRPYLVQKLFQLAIFLTLAAPFSVLAQDSIYINEIQVSTTGSDWEFVELLGRPGAPLGHLTLLVIESDEGGTTGQIDRVINFAGGVIDSNGYFTAGSPAAETAYATTFDQSFPDNTFENSTTSYLLVANFSGALNDDLDTDDDGALDLLPWTSIVDSVNLRDSGVDDVSYSPNSVGPDGSFLPSGTYRCAGDFGSNILNFSTPDGTPGAYNVQCAAPTIYLNEISVSTASTDWEYFEVTGNPGTDLGDWTLTVIESDAGSSAGNIDKIVELAGPIPRDGFWVAMSDEAESVFGFSGDLNFSNNTFENSTTTNLLVRNFTGATNDDVDIDNDGVLDTTFWDAVADGVNLTDSGSDYNYLGFASVGPDGSFLPAGTFRCPDAPAGAFSISNLLDFSNPNGTPGVSNTCGQSHAPPQIVETDPVNGSSNNAADGDITIVFNKPVDINGDFIEVDCSSYGAPEIFSGPYVAVNDVTIDPTDFGLGDVCIVTVFGTAINDYPVETSSESPATFASHILDGNGDGNEGGDYIFSFEVIATIPVGVCGEDATLIHDIQGSGPISPLLGDAVVVEAIVVGDYQETSTSNPARPELFGFYLQEEDADTDADPATSEGLFVYDPDKTLEVNEGDLVRVSGSVAEFATNTQIESINGLLLCDTGNSVTPASLDLPVSNAFASIDDFYEQVEGMLVNFNDVMSVTEQFELSRYGQLLLAEGGTLRQYSQDAGLPLNQTDFDAHTDANARRSIKLDDFNTQQNIDPVYFPQPGNFAVDNYIRISDTITGLTGVMNYTFDEWTVQAIKSSPPTIVNTARPPAPPVLAGNITTAAMNVLNYFNGDGLGGGFPTARGADSQAELDRQTAKIVSAIVGLDADVLGLMEIENDGDGPNDSLAYLVNAINAELGSAVYGYVPAGANGGTDAIKVSLIYKAGVVELVGAAQSLATAAFTDPNSTGSERNRPALAQTFRVIEGGNPDIGSAFTAVVLHLKSKGSGCGVGDDDPIQGNCNGTRTKAATALLNWLATDPTDTLTNIGVVDPDTYIIGDLNSYYQEDPMQVLYNGGYSNLVAQGDYSYVFSGNQGSLDHVLASAGLVAQSTTGGVWNINSDENSLLDYNDTIQDAGEASFEVKPATNELYADNQYRSSDHDPVLSGVDLANAPVVDSTAPADGASDVDLGSDVMISFAEAVNASASSFTIMCTETGAHSFVLTGGPTDFTLNPDIDFGLTESCTVTVIAGEVVEPVGATPMQENYVFTFGTSAQSRAVITVMKDFNDGNPGDVNVLLDCNTGLILDQDKTISEGSGVEFVVTQFDPTELNCTVTEEAVDGYDALYDTGVVVSETACVFEQIMTTTVQNCVVRNHLQATDFTVTKEWVISGEAHELPMEASADYQCYNTAQLDLDQCQGACVAAEQAVKQMSLYFSGMVDSDGFSVLPHWNGTTYCVVDERVYDDSVEADDSDCEHVAVLVGQSNVGCTIINTRFFEGIPTLSRFSLILLSMLILGVAAVSIRRYS